MKVAVDARLMSGHVRGMGQYARMLTKPVADQLWPLLPKVRADEITGEGLAAGWGFEPWWEQVCLPRLARESGASFLLCPANTGPVRRVRGMRTILVIHDLIYMLPTSILPWSTSRYQNLGRIYRRMVVPQAARHADCILTVSHFTRQQLLSDLGLYAQQVHVVPNTIDADWFVEEPRSDQDRVPDVLCVAGEAPSKNVPRLIEAFARVVRAPDLAHLRLVLAGINPRFHAVYRQHALAAGLQEQQCALLPPVPKAELQQMYRQAWGVVMPSLYEGFGIPLLEAMASGTPVACSNATSLPEVAGGAAWLFDPRDVPQMADQIAAMCRSPQRDQQRRAGQLHVKTLYHPDVVAVQAQQFWASLGS